MSRESECQPEYLLLSSYSSHSKITSFDRGIICLKVKQLAFGNEARLTEEGVFQRKVSLFERGQRLLGRGTVSIIVVELRLTEAGISTSCIEKFSLEAQLWAGMRHERMLFMNWLLRPSTNHQLSAQSE